MKTFALFLSLLLALPLSAAEPPSETSPGMAPSLTVEPQTRPVVSAGMKDPGPMKAIRLAGGVTAGAGIGVLGYATIAEFSAGPLGWAFALIFFETLTAYLAHERISGKENFTPGRPVPNVEPSNRREPPGPGSSTDTLRRSLRPAS